MIKQAPKQAGSAAANVMRQILQEPLEIAKDVGEQMGVTPVGPEQQQMASQPEAPLPQPSVLERRKSSQIIAIQNEMRHIRLQKKQQEQQYEMVAEQQEQQGEQVEQKKKQSMFEKGLAFLKRRGQGPEKRPPKAS